MKNLNILILLFLTTYGFSQVTVTTLTSSFKGSGGLSLDEEGNLYIGDFGDFLGIPDPDGLPNDVLKLDTDLNLTQYSTGFIGASGNDFDSNGILYQSDIRDNAIFKIINGVRTFVTSTGISSPVGIVFDSADNFYVCNCGDGSIQKVTPSGTSTQFASGGSFFACPNGITVDENDNLYVSNFSNNKIIKITPAGVTSMIGETDLGNGHLDYDINSRNLYIASYSGNQIYALNIDDFEMVPIAGSGVRGNTDGLGLDATFSTPNGVAVSKTGDSIYVNCAVPLTGAEINPQIIRLITGLTFGIEDQTVDYGQKAYPNPTQNRVTIEANIPSKYDIVSIKLFDILGREIRVLDSLAVISTQFEKTIDISNLDAGTYFYSVYSDARQLFNGKIIKE